MNEYEAMESDFSDWMSPSRRDLNVTALDQNGDFESLTSERLAAIASQLDTVVLRISNLASVLPLGQVAVQREPEELDDQQPHSVIVPIYPKISSVEDIYSSWNLGHPEQNAKPIRKMTLRERNCDSKMKNLYSKRRRVCYWIDEEEGETFVERIEAFKERHDLVEKFSNKPLDKLGKVPANIVYPVLSESSESEDNI